MLPENNLQNKDEYQKVDSADRWIADALQLVKRPGFIGSIEVDMTKATEVIAEYKEDGIRISYTHIVLKSIAKVLGSNKKLHQLVCGNRRLIPGEVDIGLSLAGSRCVAPVMVLKSTNEKSLTDLAKEIRTRMKPIKKEDKRFIESINKWGWLVPFSWMRKIILKRLINKLEFVRETNGTFQVTSSGSVELCMPHLFNTQAIMGIGKVKPRPIVINGAIEARTTVYLSCTCDHSIWDGRMCETFLNGVKDLLESGYYSRKQNKAMELTSVI